MLATTADVINSETGERITVIRTGEETNGLYTEGFSVFPPSLAATVYHEHPEQEERLSVVAGTLLVRIDGKLQFAGPGASMVIPPRTAHEISNTGAEPAEAIWQFRPALRTDDFLAATLASEGSRENKWRHRLRKMAIAAEFSHEYRRSTLPWTVQWPVLTLVHRFVSVCGQTWNRKSPTRIGPTSGLSGGRAA
jgi:mannose-6-phosphate isomerase-like protein (cupin superfamily)